MRPAPDLLVPRTRSRRWWVVGINLALHGLLLLYTMEPWRSTPVPAAPVQVVMLPLVEDGPRAVDMIYLTPQPGQGSGSTEGVRQPRLPETGPRPELPLPPSVPEPVAEPIADTASVVTVRPADPPVQGPRPGVVRLGPSRGQGTLWVQPLPLPPRELAQALTRSHFELVDSAVSAIVQAYLDSVMTMPTRPGAPLPSWTTEIEGQTFGIDSRYIYLGPLKIPAAILALLPIQGGGNMDLQEGRRLAAIRADLQYAVQRAETMDEFRKAIREIRERREREREFERNQRLRPPPLPPDTGRAR